MKYTVCEKVNDENQMACSFALEMTHVQVRMDFK